MKNNLSRRQVLSALIAGTGVSLLNGCDQWLTGDAANTVLERTEHFTRSSQRWLGGQKLAREYSEADISSIFRANGTQLPDSVHYAQLLKNHFADWRLRIDGLVQRPLSLSLDELKRFPSRTQITRHDCVEGWSAIGKWQGATLSSLLDTAGLRPGARYVVFYCADELEVTLDGSGRYYESIDLQDAYHPQTLLAYAMNDNPLPVAHGAPLRLRVERQLGYKQAKYVMHIKVVSSFDNVWGGQGGYWEDRGYEWYAGI